MEGRGLVPCPGGWGLPSSPQITPLCIQSSQLSEGECWQPGRKRDTRTRRQKEDYCPFSVPHPNALKEQPQNGEDSGGQSQDQEPEVPTWVCAEGKVAGFNLNLRLKYKCGLTVGDSEGPEGHCWSRESQSLAERHVPQPFFFFFFF